jgi:magnesium transporter
MPRQVLAMGHTTWVDIVKPTVQDIQYLQQNFAFHPLDLEDLLSKIERPKIDEYDNYLFLVMQFPVFRKDRRLSFPGEIDIFIGANFLVTVHDGSLKPMRDLFAECQESDEACMRHMGTGPGRMLYTILDRMVDYIFLILSRVSERIRGIEEDLFTESMRQVVEEISLVRRDLIALRRIVKPQVGIVTNLELRDRPFIQQELDVYFGDIADGLSKAWDILEDDREVMEGLSDTANSLTSYRINEVMRILTVISVVMLPLTLIAGIYGMNVPLPLANSPVTFVLITTLMVALVAGMLVTFRRRGWL